MPIFASRWSDIRLKSLHQKIVVLTCGLTSLFGSKHGKDFDFVFGLEFAKTVDARHMQYSAKMY